MGTDVRKITGRISRRIRVLPVVMLLLLTPLLAGCVEEDTPPQFRQEETLGTVTVSSRVTAGDNSDQFLDQYGVFYSTNYADVVAVVGSASTTKAPGGVFVGQGSVTQIAVPANHRPIQPNENGIISVDVPNLQYGTTYYFRLYTIGDRGSFLGATERTALTVGEFNVGYTVLPKVTCALSPTYTGSASIAITAADNPGGSGVKSITYILDGAATTVTGSTATVTTNVIGAHTLNAFATDNFGRTTQPIFAGSFTVVAPAVTAPASTTPATTTPKLKVSLTKGNAPTTMYRGRARTITGFLKPLHASGSTAVRIYRYRKNSAGAYKKYDHVHAKLANYSSYSKYTRSLKFPSKGKWRIRAYMPADGEHAATYSSYDYVTVK